MNLSMVITLTDFELSIHNVKLSMFNYSFFRKNFFLCGKLTIGVIYKRMLSLSVIYNRKHVSKDNGNLIANDLYSFH